MLSKFDYGIDCFILHLFYIFYSLFVYLHSFNNRILQNINDAINVIACKISLISKFCIFLFFSVLCSSCLYLGKSQYYNEPRYYNYFIGTEDSLYIMFPIDKHCHHWLFESQLLPPSIIYFLWPPEIFYSVPIEEILYIIRIERNGTFQSMGFILDFPVNAFELLKLDNNILLFNHYICYLLQDNELFLIREIDLNNQCYGHFKKPKDLLGRIMDEYDKKHSKCYDAINNWNRNNGYKHVTRNFIWNGYEINIKRVKFDDNNRIMSISCPGILSKPLNLVVPTEKVYSHFPPTFKEFPYITTEEFSESLKSTNPSEIKRFSKGRELNVNLECIGLD